MSDLIRKDELETAVAARRELGPEYEDQILESFLAKVEQRLAQQGTTREQDERGLKARREHQKEMILGAMGISVPLLAIAAIFTGLPGVVAVCVALAVIAIVTARQ